jgi:hypothetical protein
LYKSFDRATLLLSILLLNYLLRGSVFESLVVVFLAALSVMQLHTPTPPAPGAVGWEAQTPRNAREIEAQSTLIRNRMQNWQGSPASSLDEQIKQLSKGPR